MAESEKKNESQKPKDDDSKQEPAAAATAPPTSAASTTDEEPTEYKIPSKTEVKRREKEAEKDPSLRYLYPRYQYPRKG